MFSGYTGYVPNNSVPTAFTYAIGDSTPVEERLRVAVRKARKMLSLTNELKSFPRDGSIPRFETDGSSESVTYMVDSVYKRVYEWNRCNFRDYQNMGVNGARSGQIAQWAQQGIVGRNQTQDHPMLLIIEMIGNDVCTPHHTYDTMATPQEFYNNVVAGLVALDQILPSGSHILFIGLGDGLELYDNLHARLHPIGVNYSDVYDYLNCLGLNPCWGWMNSNETIRNFTQERANNLTAMYPIIVAEQNYTHFDIDWMPFPFSTIIGIWQAEGGQAWELIEPIDGFHPNQIANYLEAEILWNFLMANHSDWLGYPNPQNDEIQSTFGDQGGY